MEVQKDLQTYLEQGRTALAEGHGREAAFAFAHGIQLEPENLAAHLGLAEANLAIPGNETIVRRACQQIFDLQPESGTESKIAEVLLDVLDKRYENGLKNIVNVVQDDPGNLYAHALHSYLLRATGQDYDAQQVLRRVRRQSSGKSFENCFPPLDPPPPQVTPTTAATKEQILNGNTARQATRERAATPLWTPPNTRNQLIRTRHYFSQHPGIITNVLIGINVLIFLLTSLNATPELSYAQLGQFLPLIFAGQVWRLLTGMFLYGSIFSVIIAMVTLFFIGRIVEIYYGPFRYLAIYLLSGIAGGLIPALFGLPQGLGSSGVMFGIIGALGVFYIVNRQAIGGFGNNAIITWAFILILNLAFVANQGVGLLLAVVLTIVISMAISYLLISRSR